MQQHNTASKAVKQSACKMCNLLYNVIHALQQVTKSSKQNACKLIKSSV